MTPAPDTPARGDAGPRFDRPWRSDNALHVLASTRADEDVSWLVAEIVDLRAEKNADRDATITALRRQVEELQGERDHLSNDLHEARQVPWPEWAKECLRIVRECNGEVDEEVDLPEELEELLSEWDDYEAKFRAAETRIADLERRLADAERGGFRSIKTAPRDGTWIIGGDGDEIWRCRYVPYPADHPEFTGGQWYTSAGSVVEIDRWISEPNGSAVRLLQESTPSAPRSLV